MKSERVGRFRKLAGSEFHSWDDETERTVANRFEVAFRDFPEFFIR